MITSYERSQQRREQLLARYVRYAHTKAVDEAVISSMVSVHGYTREEILAALLPAAAAGDYPIGCVANDAS